MQTNNVLPLHEKHTIMKIFKKDNHAKTETLIKYLDEKLKKQ